MNAALAASCQTFFQSGFQRPRRDNHCPSTMGFNLNLSIWHAQINESRRIRRLRPCADKIAELSR